MVVIAALGFLLGSVIGSFVKAASERIIKQESINGRSYCVQCKKKLYWYDLVPVISYVILRGRCRFCHKKIDLFDFVTELVVGVLVTVVFLTSQREISLLMMFNLLSLLSVLSLGFKVFVVTVLSLVFLVDLKTGLIHNRITYPATMIAGSYLILSSVIRSAIFYLSFLQSPLASYLKPPFTSYVFDHLQLIWEPVLWAVVSAFLTSLVFICLIVVTKGRGMGWGDVKYVFFLGLVLGFPNIAVAIFLAFLLGALISVLLVGFKLRRFGQTIPFGPFLSLGAFIALVWGNNIIDWYLKVFNK